MPGVMWPPFAVDVGDATLTIRVAAPGDRTLLERWDREPSVIAATTDDPEAQQAFAGAVWDEEIAANGDVSCLYVAEANGRPIGAMQVADPHREPTHYWGEIEPNLRAIDIWIGDACDRNKGYGAAMMRAVIERCFADPEVAAIVVDPLYSNARAHRFYRRLGFKPVAPRTFGDDECLVHRLDRQDWAR